MRLSEFVEHAELKKRGIGIIGYLKTVETEFAVLARKGERVFPLPKVFHLVEVATDNRDPDLLGAEQRSILSRFRYFDAISTFPSE
jgi:hypothetical protein